MTRHEGLIVGAGGVARLAHYPAYLHDPALASRVAITGVVDSRVPAPDLGGLPVYPTIAAAIAAQRVDFVDICTPTASHQALTLQALESGLHVFCEKPVAIDLAEAASLADAARAAGRVLFPCHQYRENPAWRQLARWIADGAIGAWHLAEFHVYRAEADRGTISSAAVPWRGQRADSLGGVLLDHGTHLLYLLLDVGGMPLAVQAHLATLGHGSYDVEDTAHVVLDFPRRAATITLTWAGQERENRIRFIGSAGMAEWVGGTLRLVRRDGQTESTDFSAQLDKREYAGWMSRVLGRFSDAMDNGSSPESLREITQVATILGAAYRSAEEGRRISLA
ncbi:MAG TPA: Gfo/Idh/MocA family oxidoreductase [Gemmatimonadales bacterium]|jgi:predicted dehydrogenase